MTGADAGNGLLIERKDKGSFIKRFPEQTANATLAKSVLSLIKPRPKFGRQWTLWLDRMQANGTYYLVGEAAGHREDRQADIQQSCVRTRPIEHRWGKCSLEKIQEA